MQQYSLTIKANKRPETLERLLRVIRHRGFAIISLNVESLESQFHLHCVLESHRSLELLRHQLGKLFDVIEIS